MSIWREIWKESVAANRIMAENTIQRVQKNKTAEAFFDENDDEFFLYKSIEELKKQTEISTTVFQAMYQIRKAGNNAVHNIEISDYDKFENIQAFLQVLDFFSTLERPSHFRYN